MIGITSFGAFIPRLRLSRMSIVQSMGWYAPAIMTETGGERSMCNWDEDSITMAVASSRDCLTGKRKEKLDGLFLASTTLPFADRQNAGIVAGALNLSDHMITADFTSSQKAGTTALIAALESVKSGERHNLLVTATDRRETQTACMHEMWFGDGAASLMVGDTDVIAAFRGSHSVSCDFIDHYRGSTKRYDYMWEDRWVRDEGYSKIIPETVSSLLAKMDITMDQVDRLMYPCVFRSEHRKIAKVLGADSRKVVNTMHEVCGETGCAHPLVMLVSALEMAAPGEKIVVAGFGQGCDALCFEVTEHILNLPGRRGVQGSLAGGKAVDDYPRWLVSRDLIRTGRGIRAEIPLQTAMSALWRNRKMILGLVGGRCRLCGTPQYPRMDICVNPACGVLNSQDDYEFADIPAVVKTFTGDFLALSVDPPALYGMIQFEEGGRMMADFTDCALDDLKVGLPVTMEFKRRTVDRDRGNVNYFWKAVPVRG